MCQAKHTASMSICMSVFSVCLARELVRTEAMYKLMSSQNVMFGVCHVKVITKFLDIKRIGITECPAMARATNKKS